MDMGGLKSDLAVAQNEINEARRDISELKEHVDESFKGMQEKFDKKFETLTNAVRWGTGAMIALIGVLLTILANGS